MVKDQIQSRLLELIEEKKKGLRPRSRQRPRLNRPPAMSSALSTPYVEASPRAERRRRLAEIVTRSRGLLATPALASIGAAATRKSRHGSRVSEASLVGVFSTVKYVGPISGPSSSHASGIDTAAPGRARVE